MNLKRVPIQPDISSVPGGRYKGESCVQKTMTLHP